ncbi:hypothetical protein AB4144_17795, partial [Rhizobiaceae sp. 2RAB30]
SLRAAPSWDERSGSVLVPSLFQLVPNSASADFDILPGSAVRNQNDSVTLDVAAAAGPVEPKGTIRQSCAVQSRLVAKNRCPIAA